MKNKIIAMIGLAISCPALFGEIDFKKASHFDANGLGAKLLAQSNSDKRRFQIRSLNQMATQGMGRVAASLSGSSCGYHALSNGILCVRALMSGDPDCPLLSENSAKAHSKNFFEVPGSSWRAAIMQERFKMTARKIFQQQVREGLRLSNQGNKEEFDYLVAVIESLDPREIHYPDIWEDGFRYYANKDAIYVALWDRMAAIVRDGSSETRVRKQLDGDQLDKYFGNISVDFRITFEGVCFLTKAPEVSLKTIEGERYGQWIRTAEMPFLIEHLKRSDAFKNLKDLTIATYGEDRAVYEEHAFATEKFIDLYTKIRESKSDCIGVVLVYLSSGNHVKCSRQQSSLSGLFSWIGSWFSSKPSRRSSMRRDLEDIQSSDDSGHWISLVVARLKGSTRYYIFDSLSNANRLQDPRINEVIDILDGKKDLPGYEWTKEQIDGSAPRNKSRSIVKPSKGDSWGPLLIGAGITCGLLYAAHSYYKKNQSDKKKKE